MTASVPHGGDVLRMSADYGIAKDVILDFSANVNPRGLPVRARERLCQCASGTTSWQNYPDPNCTSLREALARKHNVPVECILVGAGATSLLGSAIYAARPKQCLLPVPAFSEYAHLCDAVGAMVNEFPLSFEDGFHLDIHECRYVLAVRACDLFIVTNPHNPSGGLLKKMDVLAIVEYARSRGIFTIVDEAFIDYVPAESVVREAVQLSNVVVVRSLTKFYGCPGLRIGFLVAEPETIARITPHVATWSVTAVASEAIEAALEDVAYDRETLLLNLSERESLAASLRELGARVVPSHANFLLLRLKDEWPDSTSTRHLLLQHYGIAVRDCNSYTGLTRGKFIRVAVRTAAENLKLLEGLRNIWK